MNFEKYLKKDEKINYAAKASFIPVFTSGIAFAIFLVLAIILFTSAVSWEAPAIVFGVISSFLAFVELLYLIQTLGLVATTCILITENRAIMCYGLLKSVFSEVPLDKISGVTIKESLFGKICGYGDIIIESSATTSGVKVKYIKAPFELKKNLPEK